MDTQLQSYRGGEAIYILHTLKVDIQYTYMFSLRAPVGFNKYNKSKTKAQIVTQSHIESLDIK